MDLSRRPPFSVPELPKKNALVLSGGGANGAWQVGVFQYLTEHEKYQKGFQIIAGTSVGSLNGAGLAHYPPEEFSKAVDFVLRIWKDYVKGSDSIYKYRWPKWLAGAWNSSLAESKPLLKILNEVIDEGAVKASGIKVRFPSVDMMSGETRIWTEDTPHLVAGIMASAAFPIVFPMIRHMRDYLTDGGIRDIAPVRQAIRAGAESLLVLHTGFSSPLEKPPTRVDEVALRILDIMADEVLKNDIEDVQKMNRRIRKVPELKKLSYKHIPVEVLGPSEDLGDSLDFSAALTEKRRAQGYEDAKKHFGQSA